jgi:hypothetical protein
MARFFARKILIACALGFSVLASGAIPGRRIAETINDEQTFVLRSNTHAAVANRSARDLGEAPGDQRMPRLSLHFNLTPAQRADRNQLVVDQQNRRSPHYRKFLSPEEFGERG